MRRALAPLVLLATSCGPATAPARHPAPTPVVAARPARPAPPPAPAPPPSDPAPPALRLPDDVVPTAYRVRFDLDPDKDAFSGHVDIDVRVARATDHVWLDATGLALTAPAYTAAGAAHPMVALPRRTEDVVGFRFAGALGPGPATLHLDFAGKAGGDFSGLFREQDGGRWYLYSQFESSFARRAVPSFDEPRWKTPWQVTVVAPAAQQVFSNTPVHRSANNADGTRTVEFEPTPPLPSYLVAVAVGPFEVVDGGTSGKGRVPTRIVVPAGHAAEAAYAARTTGAIVGALEDYFDMPLPLAKLDLVAVPSFFGAMENPGLITFSAEILLAGKGHDTEAFHHQFVWIAGHELAHQWFGDLVTLAWWDDLWLNESFATWMADKVGAALDPHWDAAVRVVDETNKAMLADTSPSARPLHREIRAAADIEGSFDAISYEKGGAVLSMFERWVGPDTFRDGVRAYLRAHAHGTATDGDFLAAIAAVATPEVTGAFAGFLDQPGVPLVHVGLRCRDREPPTLVLRQERLVPLTGAARPAAPSAASVLWKVPMCVRWLGRGGGGGETCRLLAGERGELALPTRDCPAAIEANAGAAGYYRVRYEGDLQARLVKHLRALTPAERLALAADTGALVAAGDADLGATIDLARSLLATRDRHAELAAVDLVAGTGAYVDDAHRGAWRRWVIRELGARARAIGLAPAREPRAIDVRLRERLLRVVGVAAGDPRLEASARRLADAWLAGKRAIDPDDLGLVLSIAAGGGDARLFDRMLDAARREKDGDDRAALLTGLAGFRDPALIDRALRLYLDGPFPLNETGRLMQTLFARPETQDAAWAFLETNYDAVVAKLPRFVRRYVAYTAAGFCDAAHRKEADGFLRPRVTALRGGERALGQALAAVDRCIALRARNAAAVARYFK
jgi:aminopeptidase N